MKCPSCGNFAKSELEIFFTFNVLKFKCRMCNEWLRGNLTMLALDVLSVVLYIGFALMLFTFSEETARMFGEWSFPLLGILGVFVIRAPFTWLSIHLGRFLSA